MKNLILKARLGFVGATIVEFAIVVALFVTLLIGIMEMGRVMFYWNTATELTRMGARMAIVCNQNETTKAALKDLLYDFYPLIPKDFIDIEYVTPSGGEVSEVTVWVKEGVPVVTYIPFVPLNLSLPEFKTTLPRESLKSEIDGKDNPVCG